VLRTELSHLATEVGRSVFSFEPPPGMKMVTGGLLAEVGQSPAAATLSAAKGAGRARPRDQPPLAQQGRRIDERNRQRGLGSQT